MDKGKGALELLIAGGSSFIGKNLIENLPPDWNVFATYFSNSDFPNFVNKFSNIKTIKFDVTAPDFNLLPKKVDMIIYLAANSDPRKSIEDPANDLKVNALGVINILSNIKCKKIIYFSSGAVLLDNSNLPYANSKIAGENYVKFLASKNNFNYVILRLFETYGKYSPKRKIFRRLCEVFERGEKSFEIYGDGTNLVDPMYIDDCVTALIKIIKSESSNIIIDLCRGKPISITDVAKTIASVYGIKPNLTYKGTATERVYFKGDPTALKRIFGFEAKIDLSEGIKRWRRLKKEGQRKLT